MYGEYLDTYLSRETFIYHSDGLSSISYANVNMAL